MALSNREAIPAAAEPFTFEDLSLESDTVKRSIQCFQQFKDLFWFSCTRPFGET